MNMDFEDLKTYAKLCGHNIQFSSNIPKNYANSSKLKKRPNLLPTDKSKIPPITRDPIIINVFLFFILKS